MPRQVARTRASLIGLLPAMVIAFAGYLGSILWMTAASFTSSRALPSADWVWFAQYERLWQTSRWYTALDNVVFLAIAVVVISVALATLIAIALDQQVIGVTVFRTIFLYPFAMSFVVTGVAWQWLLNPEVGVVALAHDIGLWPGDANVLGSPQRAIWAVVAACVWQGTGLSATLIYAALRGVDRGLWRAASVDGVPTWRTYLQIVLPEIRGAIATTGFLMLLGVISLYELVLTLTGGGPGVATDVPTKFIMDNLFQRTNIGLAAAAGTCYLLLISLALGVLWLSSRLLSRARAA